MNQKKLNRLLIDYEEKTGRPVKYLFCNPKDYKKFFRGIPNLSLEKAKKYYGTEALDIFTIQIITSNSIPRGTIIPSYNY